MSTLIISQHSDVPAALDLVREEVEKESKRIFAAGGDALKAGKIKPAKEAIAYAEKLAEFVKKIHKLGEDWKKLEDFRISIDDTAFNDKIQSIQDKIKYLNAE